MNVFYHTQYLKMGVTQYFTTKETEKQLTDEKKSKAVRNVLLYQIHKSINIVD